MTSDEANARRERLLMASHRLIVANERSFKMLDRCRSDEEADRLSRRIAEYRRRQDMIKAHFTALGEIAKRGDVVLH